jgi:hypothetical protein
VRIKRRKSSRRARGEELIKIEFKRREIRPGFIVIRPLLAVGGWACSDI